MALGFVYADYKTGALPYTVQDILSLIASVAVLALFLGGFIGWVVVLSLIMENRQKGA